MKPASCSRGRLLSIAICAVLSASAAQAADKPAPSATQLPQQVAPTGAEDAVQTVPAARAAASAAVSERQLLEAELIDMTSESDEGLERVVLPDGTAMMDLEGRFMSVMVATPTEDGGVTMSCHTGQDAVAHALHAHDVSTGNAKPAKSEQSAAPQALEEK